MSPHSFRSVRSLASEGYRFNTLGPRALPGTEATIFVGPEVTIGQGSFIEPGVLLLGKTVIGENCHIETGARLENVTLENGCHVGAYSVFTGVKAGKRSRFVAGTKLTEIQHIGDDCVIGAEMKRSWVGDGVSAVHGNSYLGDATIGDGVNIAAGVVTANYDGKDKKPTKIGRYAFIGVGVVLVAFRPALFIGSNTFIPPNLVIRESIPANMFLKPNSKASLGYEPIENRLVKVGNHWEQRDPEPH